MAVPVLTIVGHALGGFNIVMPGGVVKPKDAVYVLEQLNLLFDAWNADGRASVAEVLTPFVTTPALQPHTIGPTGTWVLPVRPTRIDGLAYAIGGGAYSSVRVRDDPQWWLGRTVLNPGPLTGAYYAADTPNGSLYFAGLPGSPTNVIVMTRGALASVQLNQSLNLPTGYQLAIELSLMELIADAFGATVTPRLERRAGKARAAIFNNNLRIPTLSTRGAPGSGGGWWDYRTGEWR